MAYDIGPRIGIEGEAEFRKQIQSITTVQKTLATEMQAVTSAFDKNDQSQENLTAQNKVLTKQIDAQKQKLDLLRDGLSASAEKYGENDKVTQGWQQAVNKATADLNKMERQLNDNNNILDKSEDLMDDTADATDDLGDSLNDAGKKAVTFGDLLKSNVAGQFIVDGVKRLASAVKDLFSGSIENAANIKAETSQFQQTFGELASSAEQSVSRVADASGILDTRLNTAATSIYAFARSSGADTAEAMSLMEDALQAAADGAAYYDKSLEDTSETLMSFLKGNYENDAALGVSATETTRNAKATELFGKKYNDLSEIQKQKTLLKMVTDAQKLSGAMGQAARESDGYENVMGNVNETMRQFTAAVATPVLENMIPIIQQLTNSFRAWFETADFTGFSSGITAVFGFITQNGPIIIGVIAGITAGYATWSIVVGTANAVQSVHNGLLVISAIRTGGLAAGQTALAAAQGGTTLATIALSAAMVKNTATTLANNAAQTATAVASKGAAAAQTLLNAAFVATPIGWIVLGLAAVVAAFVTLWNKSESFRQFWFNTWDNIRLTAASATNFIKENWSYIPLFLLNPVAGALKLLYDKNPQFRAWADAAGQSIKSGFSSAVNWIQSLPDQALNWGRDMIQNFIDGIKEKLSDLKEAASNVGKSIKKMLGHSVPEEGPLKDEMTWMPDMMDNLAKGILNNRHKVTDALYTLANEMKSPVYTSSATSPALATAGGINSTVAPAINYTAIYNSPAAPTPATVNRVNRKNAQQLALIVRR